MLKQISSFIFIFFLLCIKGYGSSSDYSFSTTTTTESISIDFQFPETKALIFARDGIEKFDYKTILHDLDPKNVVFVAPKGTQNSDHFRGVIFLENYLDDNELYGKIENLRENFEFDRLAFYSERDPYRAHAIKQKYGLEYSMSKEQCDLFRDKWVMHENISSLGTFPIPRSISSSNLDEINTFIQNILNEGKYAFAKPRDGMGCIGGKKIKTINDWHGYFTNIQLNNSSLEKHIFQEFIEGPSYHIDMHTSQDGKEILGIWPSKYHHTPYEVVDELKPLIDYLLPKEDPLTNRLIQYGGDLFAKFPMVGGSGIHLEVFVKDDQIYFGEWAMRPTGSGISVCWGISLGIDLHVACIQEQLGLNPGRAWDKPTSVSGNVIVPKKGSYFGRTPSVKAIEDLLGVRDAKTQKSGEDGNAEFSTDYRLSVNIERSSLDEFLETKDDVLELSKIIYKSKKTSEENSEQDDL
jgi:hypothetical protein